MRTKHNWRGGITMLAVALTLGACSQPLSNRERVRSSVVEPERLVARLSATSPVRPEPGRSLVEQPELLVVLSLATRKIGVRATDKLIYSQCRR